MKITFNETNLVIGDKYLDNSNGFIWKIQSIENRYVGCISESGYVPCPIDEAKFLYLVDERVLVKL